MNMKKGILYGRPLYITTTLFLIGALILSLLWAVTLGSVDLSVGEVYRVILYKTLGIGDAGRYGQGAASDIVWYIRLPRLVLAIGTGASLAVAGAVMQAIVKNPLADPYVLGVSSGASLGATLAILTGLGAVLGSGYVGIMAFLGAFIVSITVIVVANIGGRADSVKLILAGTAMSAICSAISSFFLFVVNTGTGALEAVVRWTMGSLAGAQWDTNGMIIGVTCVCIVFFMTQARILNLMLYGDETAITLGTDLHKSRILYLVVTALMVGFAVFTSGIIGFVGLIIPHLVRLLFGTDHKKMIPIAALVGSIFLLWADVLCRIVLPGREIPVGILTAAIGAPVFIYLMSRKQHGFGGGV